MTLREMAEKAAREVEWRTADSVPIAFADAIQRVAKEFAERVATNLEPLMPGPSAARAHILHTAIAAAERGE